MISVRWIAVGVLTVGPGIVCAEETTALGKITVTGTRDNGYTVEDSASATKLPLSLRETPQSVTVVTRERLDDQNLQSLRDVLDVTPGIYSFQYDTERVVFSARGFTVDSLMYDGVPATTNPNTDSVDETIDTAFYDRIEIVRGATGLMTGAGSPAASVNLVRKHADSDSLQSSFNLIGGSWNDRRVEADVTTPLNASGTIRARGIGVYQDKESYQNLYRKKKKAFYGVIDADVSDRTRLSLGYDYQDNQPRGNTWGSFPLFLGDGTQADWSRNVTTSTDWAFWNRRTETVFGELRHAFTNGWALRSTLSWRQYHENLALFYVFGWPDPQTGEGLLPFAYRSNGTVIEKAIDLYASGPVTLFGRQHDIVVGYNGSRVGEAGSEFQHGDLPATGNFFEWDGSYPLPEFATEPTPLTDITTRQNGFYTSGRFSLTDPLKLIAGARFATWKSDHFYLYDSSDILRTDYRKTIPYAGLVFDFAQHFSAFVSYTEIFKPQNKRDVGGTFLDPIDGRSYEVGVKGEHFDGKLNTSLTVFKTFQNNIAEGVTDPETGLPILLPDGNQATQAVDGTRTRGFELEAAGQLAPGWSASAGWSRYKIEDGLGQPFRTFVPRNLIRLFTTWQPEALRKLTIGGGINWQSSSYANVSTPTDIQRVSQRNVLLLTATARYQFTPNVSMQFNGNNLLDKKYYVLDEFENAYFGAPANYSLGVNVRF